MASIELDTYDGRTEALYRMLLSRSFDDAIEARFENGEFPGPYNQYAGQEAVAVGACAAIEEDDYITSRYRGIGHCLAKGLDPDRLMAELHGKVTGYSRGKGGYMHISDLDSGLIGTNGIVGAGAPLGTGAALSIELGGEDRIALVFMGDGTVSEGQVHEAMNLAATWGLPVLFLVENNLYSEMSPFDFHHNITDIADMSASYGIPGEIVDGMDVEAVYDAVSSARDHVVTEGPFLLEAKTYRFKGHMEGDPQPYRTTEEIDEWRERDPITSFREVLLEEEPEFTEETYESLADRADEAIANAVDAAESDPYPDRSEAYQHVLIETPPEIDAFVRRMPARAGTSGDAE